MLCTASGRTASTRTTGASETKGTARPVPASDNYLARSSADLSPSLAPGHPALAEPAVQAVRLTLAWPGARAAQPLPLLRPGPPLWMLVDVVPSLRKWSSPELGPELYYLAQLSMALSDSRTRLRARSAAPRPRERAIPRANVDGIQATPSYASRLLRLVKCPVSPTGRRPATPGR